MDQADRLKSPENPKEGANILSLITFAYVNVLFKKGKKKELVESDIYGVISDLSSDKLGNKLEDQWLKNKKRRKQCSFLWLLICCFGPEYLMWGVIQLCVRTTLIFIQPYALSKVVAYFQSRSDVNDLYLYAAVLIVVNILTTIYNHNYQQKLAEIGIKVRTSITALIYRKALKLGPSAISEVTMGKIVTLITRDVFSFENALIFINDIWISIIHISLISYLIFRRIGWSVLAGVGFYLATIPLQIIVGKISSSRRIQSAKKTDERLQLTQEVLSAMKIVKMYTWETFFASKVNTIRRTELSRLASVYYLKCIVLIIGGLTSNVAFFLLIMTYIWTGHFADAEIVYYIQSQFQQMRSYITVSIPFGIAQSSEVYAALRRLRSFLETDEVVSKPQTSIVTNPRVMLSNVAVDIKDVKILKDVSLFAEKGLLLVTGPVGSGKSSILKTILGDYVVANNGQMVVQGTTSYAPQEPWLFPSTIRQNILFGEEYDDKRYNEVLNVCELKLDLSTFEKGDRTIVGDRGVNLSKGQKARINLARAVYKNSDIYLLDDCLSSLDSDVNMRVFVKCIMEFLKDKVVILITHNINHIKYVYGNNTLFVEDGTTLTLEQQQQGLEKRITYYMDDENYDKYQGDVFEDMGDTEEFDESSQLLGSQKKVNSLYHEDKQTDKVNIGVYLRYYRFAGGFFVLILVTIVFICSQLSMSASEKFISMWVKVEPNISALTKANMTNTLEYEDTVLQRNITLRLYSLMIGLGTVLTFARVYFNFFFSIKASKNIHKAMVSTVFNSMMTFFDRHFIGNIVNRFSKDLNNIDEVIPLVIYEVFRNTYQFIGIIILIASVNLFALIPTGILLVILYYIRRYYMPTARNLKRLEAATRSPMIGYLNATLEGLSTVRATENQTILQKEFDRHQDNYTSTNFMLVCSTRAFGLWLDLLASLYITVVLLRFVFFNEGIQAGDVGLAITQAQMLTGMLQWTIRQYSELENNMTSVERAVEYADVEREDKNAGQIKENWPSSGKIEYRDVSLSYSTSKEKVLKNVNFVINSGEHIGIIGRTGAGKSSIVSALFRLYDFEGRILIDSVNSKTVPLEYLRSKIAIIPQDPILFTGTIRSNIDPTEKYTDEQIWAAIEKVNLKEYLPTLQVNISENGSNFSSGQKQLVCLARALMSQNKIIVLDEATASMDQDTSNLLQTTIKKNFGDCTIITIAHRLSTILDSDKVMVVDNGQILEYDTPNNLLTNKDSLFYKHIKQSGLLQKEDQSSVENKTLET